MLHRITSQFKKEICPFCFEYFHIKDTPYRCSSAFKKCTPEFDTVYNDAWNDSTPRGKVLIPTGKFSDRFHSSISCEDCKNKSYKRICPNCHMDLPHTTGKYKNFIFAVVGSATSGKSHYIAVLIDQIKKRIGPDMGLLLSSENDFTTKKYAEKFYQPIFEKGEVIIKTRSALVDGNVQQPMIYSIHITKDTLFEKKKVVKYMTLVFFDTAGEDLNSEDTMSTVNKYIYRSDGIILLTDPLQLESVRANLPENTPVPDKKGNFTKTEDILIRITHLIEKGKNLKPTQKIKIPMALSFSKFDAVESLIDSQFQLNSNSNHNKGFDEDDFEAVNGEMVSLLNEWDGQEVIHHFETRYSKYAFFGLSALGCNPHDTDKIPRVIPKRVEDPFLWLLASNGIIKKVKHS